MAEIFFLLITSVINLALGFFILTKKGRHTSYTIYFTLASFSIAFLGFATILLNTNANILIEKFVLFSLVSSILFIVLYSFAFNNKHGRLYFNSYILFYVVLIIVLLITDLMVVSVFNQTYGLYVEYGKLFPAFFGFIAISLISLIRNIYIGFQKVTGFKKQQLRYLVLGIAGYVLPVFVFIEILTLQKNYNFGNPGIIFAVFFTTAVSLSIINHRLFSIRTVIIKISKYLLIVISLVPVVLTIRVVKNLIFNYGKYEENLFVLDYFIAILIGVLIINLINRLEKVLIKYINPKIYYLNKLSELIEFSTKAELDSQNIYNTFVTLLKKIFPHNDVYFIEYDEHLKVYPYNKEIKELKNIKKIKEVKDHYFIQEIDFIPFDYQFRTREVPVVIKMLTNIWMVFTRNYYKEVFTKEEIDVIEMLIPKMRDIFKRMDMYETTQNFNRLLRKDVRTGIVELEEKNEDLAEKIIFERDILDILGHELRTPLSIVRNSVFMNENLLKVENPDLVKITKYNEMAKEHVSREIELLERMLSATKIDNNRLQLDLVKVDLNDVIRDSFIGLKEKAEAKGLKVSLKVSLGGANGETEGAFVFADRTRIQEVADNLLDNAIKYTEKGFVEISISKEGKYIVLSFKDSGYGISEDQIDKLGQKFYRVNNYIKNKDDAKDEIVRPGGTGLGLYVSFSLIKAMGGDIKVKSKVGVGSTFTVYLVAYTDQKIKTIDQVS
jgi:signal transduction histidine kinase